MSQWGIQIVFIIMMAVLDRNENACVVHLLWVDKAESFPRKFDLDLWPWPCDLDLWHWPLWPWPWPLWPWPWTTFSHTRLKTRILTFLTLVTFDPWPSNLSEIWWFLMCKQTDRQTDRHTDSGDMRPTRTCVPYVLLAMVWGHLLHVWKILVNLKIIVTVWPIQILVNL